MCIIYKEKSSVREKYVRKQDRREEQEPKDRILRFQNLLVRMSKTKPGRNRPVVTARGARAAYPTARPEERS